MRQQLPPNTRRFAGTPSDRRPHAKRSRVGGNPKLCVRYSYSLVQQGSAQRHDTQRQLTIRESGCRVWCV